MITKNLVETLLNNDSSPRRFEDVCNALLNAELNLSLIGTSRSWDLGRDGRGIAPGEERFLAASLVSDVSEKAESDCRRIRSVLGDSRSCVLYFCSSQPLSEHAAEVIRADLIALLPPGSEAQVLGSNHLAEVGSRRLSIVEQLYRSELEDLKGLLRGTGEQESEAEKQALRLALMTAGNQTSVLIRQETYRAAIQAVLSDGRARTPGQLKRDVSHQFRLSRLLPEEVVDVAVRRLVDEGEVDVRDDGFVLTERGRELAQTADDRAAAILLEGRRVVRERIETAIGTGLSDKQFDGLWKTVQEFIAKAFYQKGQALVESVTALLDPAGSEAGNQPLPFLDELAAACSATSSHPEQRDEIRIAILDLFREPEGPAFDWLVQLCAGFVTVCSLGMEVHSGQKIAEILGRFVLVFDTDVTLSLLCEGEPDHASVSAIQQRIAALGGSLRTANSVLKEVQHHARIAWHGYRNVEHMLPGTREDRLRLIDNAFVRAFAELMAVRKARHGHWPTYIGQFLARGHGDPLREILRSDYGVTAIPSAKDGAGALGEQVLGYVLQRLPAGKNARDSRILRDKGQRDADLYCDMVAFIDSLRAEGLDRECLLVSSGHRLGHLEARFGRFGKGHYVVTISTVLQLLSLVPGVSLDLGALKTFLFEGAKFRTGDELERLILRVLKEAGGIDLPFAKRKSLKDEVRRRLIDGAVKAERLKSDRDLSRELVRAAGQPSAEGSRAGEILVGALEATSTWSKKDEEIARLRQEVDRIKKGSRKR